jgi:hypothetical protein
MLTFFNIMAQSKIAAKISHITSTGHKTQQPLQPSGENYQTTGFK